MTTSQRIGLNEKIFEASFPVTGLNLIEASAGTGKTYSIQSLYLRLIVEQAFPIDSILVVTFTEAATKELRDRIRKILSNALQYLEKNLPADNGDYDRIKQILTLPVLNKNADTRSSHELQLVRLKNALRNFDEAAISTIHGFCSRILHERAFESGELFATEIVADATELMNEIISDYYRQHYMVVENLAKAVETYSGLTLTGLTKLGREVAKRPDAVIVPAAGTPVKKAQLQADFLAVENLWDPNVLLPLVVECKDIGHAQKTYKDTIVAADFEEIDRIFSDLPADADFDVLEKYTPGAFENSLKKNKTQIPEHLFFDACDKFIKRIEQYQIWEKHQFITYFITEYHDRKSALKLLTYDDLLTRLRQALKHPGLGVYLKTGIRRRYQAALIDEFQDTDPVQWDIFNQLFVEAELPVFLVGDPKQAIYSFRNGDIFTYYDAARHTTAEYTLTKNYRSEKRLIDAVNQLFNDTPQKHAFATSHIGYEQLSAQGKDPAESLTVNTETDALPFKLWFLGLEGKVNKGNLGESISEMVAEETAKLLTDDTFLLKNRRLKPSDIAILVITNAQAPLVQAALLERHIPAVLTKSGNVFYQKVWNAGHKERQFTQEAEAMLMLMQALVRPKDDGAIRRVLTTFLFPVTAKDVWNMFDEMDLATVSPDFPWQKAALIDTFRNAHDRWQKHSFIEAFNYLEHEFSLRAYILSQNKGERRLTNTLQISGILHQVAREQKLGPFSLINWLQEQLDEKRNPENEAHEIRLETDSDAVQILTVHRSKGLQFPVVFVPFMYSRAFKATAGKSAGFHVIHREADGKSEQIIDLSAQSAAIRSQENLAEDVRLLYVALTRAVHRCYLCWGNINQTTDTALNYLLHAKNNPEVGKAVTGPKANEKRYAEIEALTSAPNSAIALEEAVEITQKTLYQDMNRQFDPKKLSCRNWPSGRWLAKLWGIASFSALAPEHAAGTNSTYDFDPLDISPTLREPGIKQTIFTFPAGARTGNCWHSIFEHLDFTANDAEIHEMVIENLERFRLIQGHNPRDTAFSQQLVFEMVKIVLATPLAATPDAPILKNIQMVDRLSELAFDFPLKGPVKTQSIRNCLARYWDRWPFFENALAHWDRIVPSGFMTGFIDLIFRHKSDGDFRYYVLDWKSNKIGGTPESFSDESVTSEMAAHAYFLQYLFYSVALHQYLKRRLPHYNYSQNFGGIFYVFLRGVNGTPGRGIYADQPSEELLEKLSGILGEFSE
ncbi:exodeoxyribonuclease V subunit beta [bacterium]|nr:exodeoxyribonuclease V subunit beta [bacterium]